MQKMNDAELDNKLREILRWHVGKERAITRWQLVRDVFGVDVPQHLQNDDNKEDRFIREAVSRLRRNGLLICDLGNGAGRYIAANEAEFWELYQYYAKPLKVRAETLRAMKRSAGQQWPNVLQPSLFAFDEAELSV